MDRTLPGASRRAAVLYVAGAPFIVLDKSVEPGTSEALLALAHEFGHILLQHIDDFNFAVAGFSETMAPKGENLQFLYNGEIELEANLAAMQILVSDDYLHRIIEEKTWIPTKTNAINHGFPEDWFAARVQLFREIHGYDRTYQLMKERLSDPFTQFDLSKWECTDRNCLQQFLPMLADNTYSLSGLY